jgi:prevent-host-death family protein
MDVIAHRDLRNRRSEVLVRVTSGESIAITNHGRLAAIISPPVSSPLRQAGLAGSVREPRRHDVQFEELTRIRLAESTIEVLADMCSERRFVTWTLQQPTSW